MSNLNDETFQTHVKALEVKKLEKPKKLNKENVKYLNEIESRQYCFDRGELFSVFNDWLPLFHDVDEVEVECLKGLGKNDVITFYHVMLP